MKNNFDNFAYSSIGRTCVLYSVSLTDLEQL